LIARHGGCPDAGFLDGLYVSLEAEIVYGLLDAVLIGVGYRIKIFSLLISGMVGSRQPEKPPSVRDEQ
jgi:hypothetical protein